jgi:rRNA maturation protein Nop10
MACAGRRSGFTAGNHGCGASTNQDYKQPSGATTNNAHPWNHNEEQSYRAYRHDNHLGYKAYNKLTPEEQTKYWNWRTNHPENLGHPDSLVGRDNPKNMPPPPAPAPSAPAPNSNPPHNN